SAIAGGIVAGLLWSLAGAAFARFVVSSTAYAAIYSSFAIIVLFLIWLYVGWLILLTGAAVSFYCQHPEHRGIRVEQLELSAALRERLGLEIMARVARGFAEADRGTHAKRLATELNTPLEHIRLILKELLNGGFLIRVQSADERYVPAQDVSSIKVAAVLETVRGATPQQAQTMVNRQTEGVDAVVSKINEFVQQSVGSMTVRDLLTDDAPTASRSDQTQDATAVPKPDPMKD
ncbi:MAG: YihY/virulence factor BrkB family protein, partial [Gammaproteobacteria bacterium]